MSSLADSEKTALLRIARQALIAAVERHASIDRIQCHGENIPPDGQLAQPGGAFVTLFHKGRLRGCIGQLPARLPLAEVVAYCGGAVASEDPRFSRVQPEEMGAIEIEISVLSPPIDVKPAEIEPGKHGLLVSNGPHRGLLLPQVALQFHWDGIRFLQATCEKAGLPRDAWKAGDTRIQAFTAEVFGEAALYTK